MNETERITHIANKYMKLSFTTIDLLVGIVFEFDVFAELEKALAGKPSKFTDEVAEALSYTTADGGGIFDSKFDDV